jgi:hypothetical protein
MAQDLPGVPAAAQTRVKYLGSAAHNQPVRMTWAWCAVTTMS